MTDRISLLRNAADAAISATASAGSLYAAYAALPESSDMAAMTLVMDNDIAAFKASTPAPTRVKVQAARGTLRGIKSTLKRASELGIDTDASRSTVEKEIKAAKKAAKAKLQEATSKLPAATLELARKLIEACSNDRKAAVAAIREVDA